AIAQLQRTAGNRALAARAATAAPRTRLASAVIQRDAAAQALVIAALTKPAAGADGGAGKDGGAGDAGYQEAFRVLNGLAMYDMLSTLTALRRSGQFELLRAKLDSARGVFVDRLRVAFDAVVLKGGIETDDFLLRHGAVLLLLPIDQRENIIKYLDPSWFDELKFNEDTSAAIAAIKATPAFGKLDKAGKDLTDEILAEVAKRTDPDAVTYYLFKLKQLFDTPEEDPNKISAEMTIETGAAVIQETKRRATPAAAKNVGLEERASGSKKRHWTAKPGKFGGGFYYVDASDPTNIVVKANVFLRPAGTGTAADVAAVKKMEDGIEKSASTTGYLVDIVFVNSAANDALGNPPFTVDVDPSQWEVATNWAGGGPQGYAHELHHLMAFELDRYDYIESHSTNEQMLVPTRLYWFRQELDKPPNYNDPTSIMNNAAHPNDDDVCRVAGLDPAVYVPLRQKARAAKAKGKAKAKAKP
ncbi:MAG: hypothetical protein M3Q31_14240, partial [Actinomycetota bacterium]|nr:hypothetical protein [Actinomycetota bacterium]